MVNSWGDKASMIAIWLVVLLTFCGFAYFGALVVEYKYMEARYDAVSGNHEDVRNELKNFIESEGSLESLVPGYLSGEILEVEFIEDFRVFRYEAFMGGYFHVVFDGIWHIVSSF